jgi:SAM-dependent methyltransferase
MGPLRRMKRFVECRLPGFNTVRRLEFNVVRAWVSPGPDDIICDIGSGGGFFTRAIADRSRHCVGVDLSLDVTRYAHRIQANPHCSFTCGNAEKLPFADRTFTKVFSVSALEHFADGTRALEEVHRVLSDGGRLVLSCDALNYRSISDDRRNSYAARHHVRKFYTVELLRDALERSGFDLLQSRYLLCSPGSSAAYRLGAWLNWGRPFTLLFPVIYPVAWISDRVLGAKDHGYFLVIEARKRASRKAAGEKTAS